jgi:hypothetical protein
VKNFQVKIENFIKMRAIPGLRFLKRYKQMYKIISVDKTVDIVCMVQRWIKLPILQR